MEAEYDIFRGKHGEEPVWVGSVAGFERSLEMMKRMAERMPDDYFVFSSVKGAVVAVWEKDQQLAELGLPEPKKFGKSA